MKNIRVASFDIGEKNFAVAIADVQPSGILAVVYMNVVNLGAEPHANLTQFLDSKVELFDATSVVIVEKQFFDASRRKCNIRALRLSQHLLSYFSVIYGLFKTIVEYPSWKKTKLLGFSATKNTSRARKLFSINQATHILEKIAAHQCYWFHSLKKRDDIADAVCQMVAFLMERGMINGDFCPNK